LRLAGDTTVRDNTGAQLAFGAHQAVRDGPRRQTVRSRVNVTILVQRRMRAGQDPARVAAALRRVEEYGLPRQGRRTGRLFRRRDDGQVLWYVGDWGSREAYEARPRAESADTLDALCVGEAVRSCFEQFWLCWNMSLRTIMRDGTLVQASAGAALAVRPFLQEEAGEKLRTDSGLVECMLYQDLDQADHFLILRGWASPAAWEQFERERRPALDAALRRAGTVVTPVVELTLMEYDQLVMAGP
jgi:quinol monooxygenase YgiN